MRKLLFLPLVLNVIVLMYMVVYLLVQRFGPDSNSAIVGWRQFNFDFAFVVQWIVVVVSFIVPFVKSRTWLRVTTPLMAIAHIGLVWAFWSVFQYG